MLLRLIRLCFSLFAARPHSARNLAGLLVLLGVAACGGGSGGSPDSSGATGAIASGGSSGAASSGTSSSGAAAVAVQVTIAPTAASVVVGTGSVAFTATVMPATGDDVSWQVSGVPGGNQIVGTISPSGVYSAPATLPTPATVTVTAAALVDPTRTASASVSVLPTTPVASELSVPSGLAASKVASGSVTLTWVAATETGGSGVGGYYVYRGGTQIATVTSGTGYTDSPLAPSTSYSYQVAAFDQASPPTVSALSSALGVTTLADTQAPTLPTALTASAVATGSVSLSWVASTDLPNPGATGVGGYDVYRNGSRIATVASGTSYTDSGLALSTTYSYQLSAFDKASPANVSALSAAFAVTTSADSQAPTVPTGLTASGITLSSATLNWSASTDLPNPGGSGVGGYYVYRNGSRIATVASGTSYTDGTLRASATYSYQIAAFDKAATPNVSALSSALSVATLADTQAPTLPTALTASAVATGSVSLSWVASTDLPNPGGTGVGGYYLYRNGSRIATVSSGTSYTDSPLAASTSYSYQLAAFDQAPTPNVSALTAALAVATLADAQAPTVPTGLTASSITLGSATLSWNASTDLPNPGATGVGGYNLFRNGTLLATVSTGTSYVDSTLTASTTYSYQVEAFDKAAPANISALSFPQGVTTQSTLTLTPRTVALTRMQTQQFGTNAPGGMSLIWSVDAVPGGNSTVGTISSGGLYTAPASAGTHALNATSATNSALAGTAAIAVTDLSAITTYHNDLARTGQNLQEYALTPSTVSSGAFGKRWSCALDGSVYAQPLYVANLAIGGGTHNVLFVATMHDSIDAFDADNPGCVTYWHVSFISPSAGSGITTISSAAAGCNDTPLEYGITGTPVIDPSSQTIYLVAATTENGTYFQRLHALNIASGAETANSPAVIAATLPGTGDGGTNVTFNPLYQNQRPGLVLTAGGVVIGWGSHCDNAAWPWHGWIMRYDATSLARTAAFNVTPNGSAGGIWMSGGAPAVDSSGNMFFSTGNGSFDDSSSTLPALAPNNDFGESFLNLNSATLAVQDFYTPSSNASWTSQDLDISAGGITVLPDGVGPQAHPNLLVGSDKQGHLWVIDRNNMSGFLPNADNTVQYLTLPLASKYAIHAVPAYWNGTVYVGVGNGPVMALQLSNGLVPTTGTTSPQLAVAASKSNESYAYPNPSPVISASPLGGAIVWVLDNNANGTDDGSAALGPAILRAYDATNLATRLYSSATLPADAAGNAAKFTLPVVANGHVYVVGAGALTVYGLAP